MSEADKLHALTEAMSAMSVAYFTGNVNRSRLNPKLRAFFERIAEFMRAVVARSIKIKQAQAAGAISADFESFLARSVGLDFDQTIEVKAHAAMGSYAGVASGQTIGQTTYSISAHADEFSEDLRKQAEFLDRSAKARGFADANVMAAEAPEAFSELSKQWRIFHQRLAKSGELRNNAQSDEIDRTLYGSALDGLPHSSANALDAAQAYLGTSDGAGGTAQGGESGKSQIVEWARESGRLVSKIPWRLDGKLDVGQGEHHVFADKSGRWVKLTRGNGGQYGITLDLRGPKWGIGKATVWQYLERLVLQNQTFGDDIRLHGVYQDKHGNVNVITSQPDVAGGEATMAQMETAFKGAGFVSLGDGAWYRAADNLMLVDMHDQNAVILDGQVIVFDASALNPSKDQLDALRKQGVKIPESSGNAKTRSIAPVQTAAEENAAMEDAVKDFESELSKPQQERLRRVARKQFADVERLYAEILRAHDEEGKPLPAPNGKPSKLNRRQWVQVRTPLFKRWFGDWEGLALQNQYNKFVDRTLSDHSWGGSMTIRPFDADEISSAQQLVGIDASGFTHEINANQLRHAKKRHPDLTDDDLRNLPTILDAWDYIETGTPKRGFKSLRYVKEMPSGTIYYVERLFPTSRSKAPRGVIFTAWKESGPSTRLATGENRRPRYARSAGAAQSQHAFSAGKVNPESVSKVVDANGEPLEVYHGGADTNSFRPISFWTTVEATAETYAAGGRSVGGGGGVITRGYLSIKKTLDLREITDRTPWHAIRSILEYSGVSSEVIEDFSYADEQRPGIPGLFDGNWSSYEEELVADLKKSGFDGVIITEDGEPAYIAFAPTQIKSATANEGMFSESGNITLSIAPVQAAAEVEGFLAALDKDPALRRERVAAALSRVKAIKREAGRGNGVKPLARARCEPKMRRGLYDFP